MQKIIFIIYTNVFSENSDIISTRVSLLSEMVILPTKPNFFEKRYNSLKKKHSF